ncbi:MAG: hypothetical protein CVU29_06860 [Betaproteobacteria bacterium HGW-Betaproteobacteria-22]|nr:MAG: hypothetical protein CVU29_06860 [Betaproteobacteria bacterium HGW-Betaproteobacteria-22]
MQKIKLATWPSNLFHGNNNNADHMVTPHDAMCFCSSGATSRFGRLSYDVFVGKPINKPQRFQAHQSVAGFNFNYSY